MLSFAQELRSRTNAEIVFLTSNEDDFSDGGSKPHPDLQADFARLAIQLNFTWGWAAHTLHL